MLAARSFKELVLSARKATAPPGDPFVARRAAIVAGIGPAVFTAGFAWTLAGLLLTPNDLYWRPIIFNPAHQLMVAGTIISLVCLPVAREMSESSAQDLVIPDFEALAHEHRAEHAEQPLRRYSRRHRGA